MKIGFNMFLWTDRVGPQHHAILADLKATGYDGAEIPVLAGDVGEYRDLARVLDDLGLERTTACAILDPKADPLSANAAARMAALISGVQALDRAHALGAPLMVGPMYQVLGQFTGIGPTDAERARAVDYHRALGDAAQERGVVVALEPLNRFEAYFLNLTRDASAYVDRVDHPNIKMMFDTFHANIEEADAVAASISAGANLAHVHISENDRGVPARGHIPFAATFGALKRSGYDKWLTIESFGRSAPAMAAATKIWRDLSSTPEEVYREGFRLIRDGWDAA